MSNLIKLTIVLIFLLFVGIPKNMLSLVTTSTNITVSWTLPLFVPQIYKGYRLCLGLCESLYTTVFTDSISSPYIFTGIDPSTFCIVGLNGIYGSDQTSLSTEYTTTLSSGKLCYIIIFTIIMLFSHYLQHPLHLSVISLYHQLRQGP